MSSPELELAALVRDAVQKALREVVIGAVAKIITFDATKMTATVQPLLMISMDGMKQAPARPLTDLPVKLHWGGGWYIKPSYQSGDLVWISFATYPIEQALKGQFASTSGRIFDRQSASVDYGIMPAGKGASIPDLTKQGMVIGNEEGTFLFHASSTETKIVTQKLVVKTGTTEYVFQQTALPEVNVGTHGHLHSDLPATPSTRTIGGPVP